MIRIDIGLTATSIMSIFEVVFGQDKYMFSSRQRPREYHFAQLGRGDEQEVV